MSALPARYAALIAAAEAGTLPKGPVHLDSGMVLDLAGYVLAWAEGWPLDLDHRLWRLDEALSILESPARLEAARS